jgi:hypothetical protein
MGVLVPITYRAEVVQPIIDLLKAGESCSVVGVGDTGKSRLSRFLARVDVRAHYFGTDAPRVLTLYLNCKPFAPRTPPEFYLHLLDQLIDAIKTDESMDDVFSYCVARLEELSKEIQTNPALLAKRNLDKAIDEIFRAGAKQLVLILDDYDDLCAYAPPYFFSDLRSIRDNHKCQIVYVTLTRRELYFLRTGTHAFEEFFDLFSAPNHTVPLPPYTEADSMWMARDLAMSQNPPHPISDMEVKRLYELSGGHAGLLRPIFFARSEIGGWMVPDVLERLDALPDIQFGCQKIWESVEAEEQAGLKIILERATPSTDDLHRLQRRGLIRMRFGVYPEFFSPVFARYLGGTMGVTPSQDSEAIDFSLPVPQVRVYGQLITNLTFPEYDLLSCLYNQMPAHVLFAQLIQVMRLAEQRVPAMNEHGNPLHRLEQYIQHLKAKLGPAGNAIQQDSEGIWLSG